MKSEQYKWLEGILNFDQYQVKVDNNCILYQKGGKTYIRVDNSDNKLWLDYELVLLPHRKLFGDMNMSRLKEKEFLKVMFDELDEISELSKVILNNVYNNVGVSGLWLQNWK